MHRTIPLLPFVACALAVSLGAAPQDNTRAPAAPQAKVTEQISTISDSELASRIKLGTSRSGQMIEALRFSTNENPATNTPAILVIANLDGSRPFATNLALDLAERLNTRSDGASALLDVATVFIIPQPNPDAAAAHARTPLWDNSATGTGRDTDRDGLIGEDPAADVNGDGLITWMRVPDPDGKHIADPRDSRLTVKADAEHGERGMWKLVREGFDSDGDERVSEDNLLDAELQHSFPAGFEEHTAKGGLYGGHEPEAKALMDFILAHPELAIVITLDGQDTLVSAPETTKTEGGRGIPDGKVIAADAAVLAEIGRGFTEYAKDAPKADSLPPGSFQRWIYEQRGILTLDSALWVMPTKAPKDEEPAEDEPEAELEDAEVDRLAGLGYLAEPDADDEAAKGDDEPKTWRKDDDDIGHLKWLDASGEDWRFVDWQTFEHPQLGPVEIGGWAPFALVEPPAEALAEMADNHWKLLTSIAGILPQVNITAFTAEPLGGDLWRVEALIENPALLPLVNRAASRARTSTRARVELTTPADASIIVGQTPNFISRLDGLAQGSSEFEWLVHTENPGDLRLVILTRTAGGAEANIEIKKEQR